MHAWSVILDRVVLVAQEWDILLRTMFSKLEDLRPKIGKAPTVGLEPTTTRLRALRSTD